MVTFPAGETVTLLARTLLGQDSDGNDQWSDTATVIAGCPVWPRTSSELTQGRDTVVVGLTVILPAGTVVQPTDRVAVRGETYEVEGEPGVYGSPFTGLTPGVQVALTRAEG